ncbi:MAG: hypothetical protein PHH26_05065 [Candidatus Thermoplasmatota archaeon]|nr:hypothetical protein [Candidatus Thermoplasmatota archaeon]
MQKKSKVSSWPSWEEVPEDQSAPNKGKEIEDEFTEEKSSFEPAEKGEAAGGVMVVYDAPSGEGGSVIEINAPATIGKMRVDIEVEQTAAAKAGLIMTIIGAFVAIGGICAGVWYGTDQMMIAGVYYWNPLGFALTMILLGTGFVMLLIGVVLTSYGRKIKQKS